MILGLRLSKDIFFSFIWQHLFLLLSLEMMTLGIAFCLKSCLGSSAISSIPYVMSIAGGDGIAPALSVGGYTIIMNFILVFCQILVLRRRFSPLQLFQLVIGFVFGWLIDLNMSMLSFASFTTLPAQIAAQLAGCVIMGIGISFEVKCGSVTMPGEGISVAISRVSGASFAKVKMFVDTSLVVIAIGLCYLFFSHWLWDVIGPGTLFAMLFIGYVVKVVTPHIAWFDKLLDYPGFERIVVGLLRFINRR